jgi:chorismate synthase
MQKTVDLSTMENVEISVAGRHDPAIIHRVCPVVDAISAICVADMLISKYGVDCLSEG